MNCYNVIWTQDQYGDRFDYTEHYTSINKAFREVARLITAQPKRIVSVADCNYSGAKHDLPY